MTDGSGTFTGNTFSSDLPFQVYDPDADFVGTTISSNTYVAGAAIGLQGMLNGDQTLTLFDGLPYKLNYYFYINPGATLTIASGVELQQGGNTHYDIQVKNGGTLIADGVNFAHSSLDVYVYGVGVVRITNSSIAGNLYFYSVQLSHQVLRRNDFSGSFHLTVDGDPNDTLVAEHNWWGTNDANEIEDKITHHFDDSDRPTVDYIPFLTGPPPGFLVLKEPLAIDNIYSTTDGFFTDFYFWSAISVNLLNTLDPLRYEVPFTRVLGDSKNYIFGNTLETNVGWTDLSEEGVVLAGRKEKGQWSRLGQVIDPSVGFLVFEADYGTRQWRWRQLATESSAVFEYHASDPGKLQEDFAVCLYYVWRCLGLAKEDKIAWFINFLNTLQTIVKTSIPEIKVGAEVHTVRLFWNLGAEKLELHGVGVSLLPEDSSLKAWVYANVRFEDQYGTPLGSLPPLFAGWPGADPLKSGLYDSYGQVARSTPEVLTLPVGEPVTVRLDLGTRAEAKGAAESYAGILGYELKIQGPPGTEPLIFTGTDPSPNDMDLSQALASSLLQAAETEAFVVGPVYTAESFGESNSVNDTGVVVLPIDANSPVSGVFVPIYLVPDVNSILAHVDAYWSEGTDLSNTCVEFMLVGDANVFHIDGGIASELFTAEPTEPFAGLDRHSGRYDLELDLSDVLSGNYVLAITYGEPNYAEPNSCIVVQGLSVESDPNLGKFIVGDLTGDDEVDWADLGKLVSTWLQPVPMAEKDLYPDAIIDFRDFTIFARQWLEGTMP